MGIKLALSNVCTAFLPSTVGTSAHADLLDVIKVALHGFPFDDQAVPGQGFVPLPEEAVKHVSAGVGKRTANPEDYVCRVWRGRVDCYLKREKAAPVDSVAAIVYTTAAYCQDPKVTPEERNRILTSGASHVIVAVLAFAGSSAPLSPYRFVSNLAGGNREAETWSAEDMRAKAQEVIAYDAEWCVVAD